MKTVTLTALRQQQAHVRSLMGLAVAYAGRQEHDNAARVGGELAVAALELSKMYTARAEAARALGDRQ